MLTLNLYKLLILKTFKYERGMKVERLFNNIKEVVPSPVKYFLTLRESYGLTFNTEDRLISNSYVKTVSRKGEDLLLKKESLIPARYKAVRYSDLRYGQDLHGES